MHMQTFHRCAMWGSLAVFTVLGLGVAACDRSDRRPGPDTSTAQTNADTSRGIPEAELDTAARDVMAFLRGRIPFDQIELADTVVLFVSPEGGGTRATFSREDLRDPSSWTVTAPTGRRSLVPPAELDSTTTRVGRHFNCMEYPLSTRFAELAPLPHVGVKLERVGEGSCLQTWNLTLVFDSTARPPRLVAAVYDQWEW